MYIFCTKINKAYNRNTVYKVGQNVIMITVKKNSKIHSELKITHLKKKNPLKRFPRKFY